MPTLYKMVMEAINDKIQDGEAKFLLQKLAKNPVFCNMIQITFEAGRTWQAEHPTAKIDVPDYDAPVGAVRPTITVINRGQDMMAYLNGDRALCGCGPTADAAIMDVLRSHSDDGIELIFPDVPKVGESVKVWLPGETPWADCVSVNSDGSWQGQIKNDLVNTAEHGIKLDDVLRFVPMFEAPNCPWRSQGPVLSSSREMGE